MKLRIQENSIRLRLSQSEVDNFSSKGIISGRTEFPGGSMLLYQLHSGPLLLTSLSNNTISITLPQVEVEHWVSTDQVGINHDLNLENGDKLSILVEKDFKCLTQRGEDESDMFPNPNESH